MCLYPQGKHTNLLFYNPMKTYKINIEGRYPVLLNGMTLKVVELQNISAGCGYCLVNC